MNDASRSSALIVGCGYLGRRAADCWHQAGVDVYVTTRSERKAVEFRSAGFHPIVVDLSRAESSNVPLPDVDHVLWAIGFDRSGGTSRETIWLDGLRRLLQSIGKSPRHFTYVSSTSVYGDADGAAVDESTTPDPATEAGICCLKAESLLREFCNRRHPSTRVCVLRLAGIYGPDRLLQRIESLKSLQPLSVVPDQPLNLIHVDDAVRLIDSIRRAVDTAGSDIPTLVNGVNSGTLTRRDYYTALAELVGAPPPVFADDPMPSQRGGNKRVTSTRRDRLPAVCQFDDVRAGLRHAVANSKKQ
ncbi:MAG: NAD-dependent epimerase/dehydratase family protein [Planctomycetaceae bacterium]